MEKYNNYMVNAVIVCVIILLLNACTLFGQNNNDLMEVHVSISVPEEDLEQYDTVVAYYNLESLAKSNDLVKCFAVLYDVKEEIVQKELSDYIEIYLATTDVAGYPLKEGEDIVYKTVYFNKYGYMVPYRCAISQLKGNESDVKVLREDEYQRVHHYEIED
jgi:hypothetical protein